MSADRLRAAADRLDKTPLLRIDSFATEEQGVQGRLVGPQVQALLRAVADAVPVIASHTSSGDTPPEWGWGAGTIASAALVLADAILGGSDE